MENKKEEILKIIKDAFDKIEKLYEVPIAPDENTPIDTLCEVWGGTRGSPNPKSEKPIKRYFAGKKNGEMLFWCDGATSKTSDYSNVWRNAEIIQEVQ